MLHPHPFTGPTHPSPSCCKHPLTTALLKTVTLADGRDGHPETFGQLTPPPWLSLSCCPIASDQLIGQNKSPVSLPQSGAELWLRSHGIMLNQDVSRTHILAQPLLPHPASLPIASQTSQESPPSTNHLLGVPTSGETGRSKATREAMS